MDEVRMDMIGRRFFADYSWGEMCELLEFEPEKGVKPAQLGWYLYEYAEEVFEEYFLMTEEEYDIYRHGTIADDEHNFVRRDSIPF